MRTIDDAHKIESHKQKFIGKPLIYLLREIRPQIKMVTIRESSIHGLGAFIFKFVDSNEIKSYNKAKKYPIRITVFVAGKVKNKTNQSLYEKEKWSKEDERIYGNLTIVNVAVFGEQLK